MAKHESQEAVPSIDGVSDAAAVPEVVTTAPREGVNNEERRVASMKAQRLIDWNCESLLQGSLLQLLKKIAARRTAVIKEVSQTSSKRVTQLEMELGDQSTALDEVCEIIKLPKFDPKVAQQEADSKAIDLEKRSRHSFVISLAFSHQCIETTCSIALSTQAMSQCPSVSYCLGSLLPRPSQGLS
jgi:hypothetical protein